MTEPAGGRAAGGRAGRGHLPTGLVHLMPDTWVRVPGTPIEVFAMCFAMVRRDDRGIWNVGVVPGGLLIRIALPDGRKSWPRPRPPLPWRQP